MSVAERSDAVHAAMPMQAEGRRPPHLRKSPPQLDLWLVGWVEETVAGTIKPRLPAEARKQASVGLRPLIKIQYVCLL